MNYRFIPDLDANEPEEGRKMPTHLGEDSGSTTISATSGHQPGEDPAWAAGFYELSVNEPDVDMEGAAELMRLKLGTQVDIKGNILVIHLLSHKIRHRLMVALEELTQNSQVQPDSVSRAA
jgi:hypothetical protein